MFVVCCCFWCIVRCLYVCEVDDCLLFVVICLFVVVMRLLLLYMLFVEVCLSFDGAR